MASSDIDPERKIGISLSNEKLTGVSVGSGKVDGPIVLPYDPNQGLVDQLTGFVGALKQNFGEFERAGMAIPGLVEAKSRRVAYSAGFSEFPDLDIAQEVKGTADIELIIENDANSAAFGEFRIGGGRGARHLFYVTLGHGVGGSFIFDGKILHGTSGFAGEFGYVAIDQDGTHLEEAVSSDSVVRRTLSRIHQDSTSALSRVEESAMTVEDIIEAAKNGDDFAILMLERTGAYLGSALASVINLLNVDRIVLGGFAAEAGEILLEPIKARAREASFAPSFADVTIVSGELGENAAAIGAALISK